MKCIELHLLFSFLLIDGSLRLLVSATGAASVDGREGKVRFVEQSSVVENKKQLQSESIANNDERRSNYKYNQNDDNSNYKKKEENEFAAESRATPVTAAGFSMLPTSAGKFFKCPENFGYYPDSSDCSKYFVCVFGEPLHESCTGGLYFSAELQTCDWPRNVLCFNNHDQPPTSSLSFFDIVDDTNIHDDGTFTVHNSPPSHHREISQHEHNNQRSNNAPSHDARQSSNRQSFDHNHDRIRERESERDLDLIGEKLRRTKEQIGNNYNETNKNALMTSNSQTRNFHFPDGQNSSKDENNNLFEERKDTTGNRNSNNNNFLFHQFLARHLGGYNVRPIETSPSTEAPRVHVNNTTSVFNSRSEIETPSVSSLADVTGPHHNKILIDTEPQPPSYEAEAIPPLVDSKGGVHFSDGPGGTFGLTGMIPGIFYHHKGPVTSERHYYNADKSRNRNKVTNPQFQYMSNERQWRPANVKVENGQGRNPKSHPPAVIPSTATYDQYIPVIPPAISRSTPDYTRHPFMFDDDEEEDEYVVENPKDHQKSSEDRRDVRNLESDRSRQEHHINYDARHKSQPPVPGFLNVTSSPTSTFKPLTHLTPVAKPHVRPQISSPISEFLVNSLQQNNNSRSLNQGYLNSRSSNIPPSISVFRYNSNNNENPEIVVLPDRRSRVKIIPKRMPKTIDINHYENTYDENDESYFSGVNGNPEDGSLTTGIGQPYTLMEPSVTEASFEKTKNDFDDPGITYTEPDGRTSIELLSRNNVRTTIRAPSTSLTFTPSTSTTEAPKLPPKANSNTSRSQLDFKPFHPYDVEIPKVTKNDTTSNNKNHRLEASVTYDLSSYPKVLKYSKPPKKQTTSTTSTTMISFSTTSTSTPLPVNNINTIQEPVKPRVTTTSTTTTSTTTPSPTTVISTTPRTAPTTTFRSLSSFRRSRPTNKRLVIKPRTTVAPKIPSRPESMFSTPSPLSTAGKCSSQKCKLPDCNCGSSNIPGGLSKDQVPQIVMITFDDAINDLNWEIYDEIFNAGRKNPNGCPILGTFYVSHEWTDYGQVQSLYSKGHEMASHGITHSFGEKFSKQEWMKEIQGQREILHLYGGVKLEDIRGMRAPFLQIGGNKMFEMLFEANFTYDSSMPVFDNKPPFFPYTLDYSINHECMIAPCPSKSFPGLWEVGMVMWEDLNGGRCSMGDACSNPNNEDDVHKMLMNNFKRHYTTNRAPFGLFYHSAWFTSSHHRRGFIKFLDEINSYSDVFFTTNWQMIQWMRNPTPLKSINSFDPWKCDTSKQNVTTNVDTCHHPSVCNVRHEGASRFMKTCQPCPTFYPWLGKTGFTQKPNG